MFPVAVIDEPTLKVVPVLVEPTDEILPSDDMFPSAVIADCGSMAPDEKYSTSRR